MTTTQEISPDDLKVFLQEAESLLEVLDEDIIRLEREADDVDLLQEIFRAAHTLKGSSGMLGFEQMAHLTHAMEDLLDRVRNGQQAVTAELVDVLLLSLDGLKALKDAIVESGDDSELDTTSIVEALRAAIADDAPAATTTTASLDARATAPDVAERIEAARGEGIGLLRVDAQIDPESEWAPVRAFQVLQELADRGDLLASVPSAEEIEEEQVGHRIEVLLASGAEPATIEAAVQSVSEIIEASAVLWVADEGADTDAPAGSPATGTATDARSTIEGASSKIETLQSVRIDVDRLDALMNMVGELAIDRTRIEQISRALQSTYKEDDQVRALAETSAHIVKMVDELHESMMQVRMLPVGVLFSKFPRMVRDLARSLGKDLELIVEGEGTEIDRSVIDRIRDPLVHLMRNAVDHGVEPPDERERVGKARRASVRLTARHEQGQILITIEDDGRGIDPDALRAVAVRKGLRTETEVERLSDRDALELIFEPGFSTAEQTTEVSGRGVGGDVIRRDVESLNGRVEVQSELGTGTTFTLRLPLTLATFGGLLVVSGGRTYALPLSFVRETVRAESQMLDTVMQQPVLKRRGEVMPLVPLCEATGEGVTTDGQGGRFAVIVQAGDGVDDRPLAIGVDELIDQHEIVVKSLSSYLGRTRGISGATILGDGQVVLIVDIPTVIKRSLQRAAAGAVSERNEAWAA